MRSHETIDTKSLVARLSARRTTLEKELQELQSMLPEAQPHERLRIQTREASIKSEVQSTQHQIQVVRSVRYGEEDAFGAYRIVTTQSKASSWELLAYMQHHRVPTRLLDWTGSLGIAVFFAIQALLEQVQRQSDFRHLDLLLEFAKKLNHEGNRPCVWVLNPYHLAREAGLGNWVGDITLRHLLDYYSAFFVQRDWPFSMPIPARIPWSNDRLESQQGCFTIQGMNGLPMDRLPGARHLCRSIEISPEAAAYGAYMLSEQQDLDQYAVFRDSDSLGLRITNRYLEARPRILIVSADSKYFASLLEGEYQFKVVHRVHKSEAGPQGNVATAVESGRRQLTAGEPFDVLLFDQEMSFPAYEACVGRVAGLIRHIILVSRPCTYAQLTLQIRECMASEASSVQPWPRS